MRRGRHQIGRRPPLQIALMSRVATPGTSGDQRHLVCGSAAGASKLARDRDLEVAMHLLPGGLAGHASLSFERSRKSGRHRLQ